MNMDFDVDKQNGSLDYETLDKGIRHEVRTLRAHGVETYESCDGSEGHCFPDPTIHFFGGFTEGFRALSVALYYGLKVSELRLVWRMEENVPVGPAWQLVFIRGVAQRIERGFSKSQAEGSTPSSSTKKKAAR